MNKIRRNTAYIPGFGVDRACCAREIPLSASASETLACQLACFAIGIQAFHQEMPFRKRSDKYGPGGTVSLVQSRTRQLQR